MTWRAACAEQIVFNGPEWDAIITRDRRTSQTSGVRVWALPDVDARAPQSATPLTGAPPESRFMVHIHPRRHLLFVDARGRVSFQPEREAGGTGAAPQEEAPLYVAAGTAPASATAALGPHSAPRHPHAHRRDLPVSAAQVWGVLGAVLASLIASFAAAWVNLAPAPARPQVAVVAPRQSLLKQTLAKARSNRAGAIALEKQARGAKAGKDRRALRAKARLQWARVEAVVSLDEAHLQRWTAEAAAQNRALRSARPGAPRDRLDAVAELLLQAEAVYGLGVSGDAKTIAGRIAADFGRARIASDAGGAPVPVQAALRKRLPGLYPAPAKAKRVNGKPRPPKAHTSARRPRSASTPMPHRRSTPPKHVR